MGADHPKVDSSNRFFVTVNGDRVVIQGRVPPIMDAYAVNQVAWLVATADPGGERLAELLAAIRRSGERAPRWVACDVCEGRGRIVLFTSIEACDACDGGGRLIAAWYHGSGSWMVCTPSGELRPYRGSIESNKESAS